MNTLPPIATARGLLAAVGPFGPAVEDGDLVFAAEPPGDLIPILEVLQTGVRALLTGRRWYGCDGRTGRVVELNADSPIPGNLILLCAEGDRCWDRISPGARIDLPAVFAPVATRCRG